MPFAFFKKSETFTKIVKIKKKIYLHIEAVVQRCFVKKLFWKFPKIHRKTPMPESLF